MIYTKNTRKTNTGTEYEVRTLGHFFWISEDEFRKAVQDGQVFFKANKPVYLSQL